MALSGGTLTISDINGGTSNDAISFSSDGTTLTISGLTPAVSISGGPTTVNATTVTIPLADITAGIVVNLEGGTDALTIASDISITGASNTLTINGVETLSQNSNTVLSVEGDITANNTGNIAFNNLVFESTGGNIQMSTTSNIVASGLDNTIKAAGSVTLDVQGGASSRLTNSGNLTLRIDMGTGEFIVPETFFNSVNTNLTIIASDVTIPNSINTGFLALSNGQGDATAFGVSSADANTGTFEITDGDIANISAFQINLLSVGSSGGVNTSAMTIESVGLGTTNLELTNGNGGVAGPVNFIGSSSFDNLTIFSSNGITQNAAITVNGTTNFSNLAPISTGSIVLDNNGNNFIGKVSMLMPGQDISLTDTNALLLGNITTDLLALDTGDDLTLDNATVNINGSGSSTLNTSANAIVGTGTINQNAGRLTISSAQNFNLTNIDYNGAPGTTLDANLSRMTAGDGNTFGTIELANILNLPDNGSITVTDELLLLEGTGSSFLIGNNATVLGAVRSIDAGVLEPGPTTGGPGVFTVGNLSMAEGGQFTANVNGTTVGSQHDQLIVNGTVTLGGSASLSLVGGFDNSSTTDEIIILANDGSDAIVGTFDGLPEGSAVSFGQFNGIITYVGGTGNDIALLEFNTTPVAEDDTATTDEDNTVAIVLTTNDTDADGDDLEIQSVDDSGLSGLVSIEADNETVTYDPNGQFDFLALGESATDSFEYTVSDGKSTAMATVTVTITGVNDAPQFSGVSSNLTRSETVFNRGVNVNVGGLTDVDVSDVVTSSVSAVSQSGDGAGTLTDQQLLDAATLVLNNSGTTTLIPAGETTANVMVYRFNFASANIPTLYDFLGAGDVLVLDYTFTATDTQGASDNFFYTINISGENDAPDAVDDDFSSTAIAINEDDTAVSIETLQLLDNDSDAEGDALEVVSVDAASSNGGLISFTPGNTTLTYNPNGQFDFLAEGETATDTFEYTISDGTDTSMATVTVNITGVNDAPNFARDSGGTTQTESVLNSGLNIGLGGLTDVDLSDMVTGVVTSIAQSGDGTGVLSEADLLARIIVAQNDTPASNLLIAAGETGPTSPVVLRVNLASLNDPSLFSFLNEGETLTLLFTVAATDNAGASDNFFVEVNITGENAAPTITSSATASVLEDQTDAVDVDASDDSDSEGSGLTFSLSGGADINLFNIDSDTGVVTFNIVPDFENPTSADDDNDYEIQVTVTDSGGLTAVQDITITVTDVTEVDPANAFTTVWKIDNPGPSGLNSITIPTNNGLTYNYTVDWGDGTVEAGLTGNATHAYDPSGPKEVTVRISGTFPAISFGNVSGTDNEKILDVTQWGNIEWSSMSNAFNDCINLDITASDAPDLSNVTSFNGAFADCTSLVGTSAFSSWVVTNVTDMGAMFARTSSFNQDISSWNVSNVVNFVFMFEASAFNQPIGNWNLGASSFFMAGMFLNATSFDQDLSDWDISNLGNALNMFSNTSLSTANYDSLLNGWATQEAG